MATLKIETENRQWLVTYSQDLGNAESINLTLRLQPNPTLSVGGVEKATLQRARDLIDQMLAKMP